MELTLDTVLSKYDRQIEVIAMSVNKLTVAIEVLMTENKHNAEKLDKLIESSRITQELPYKIKEIMEKCQSFTERLQLLEKTNQENQELIEELSRRTNWFHNFLDVIVKYWPIFTACGAGIGLLISEGMRLKII